MGAPLGGSRCVFRPFLKGPEQRLGSPEEKRGTMPRPRISSDLLKPPSLKLPFTPLQDEMQIRVVKTPLSVNPGFA